MGNYDVFSGINDVQKLNDTMMEHSAMANDIGEIKSFPLELTMISSVLRENHVPQETINMVLAARCGLPISKIDLKSPVFQWAEDATRKGYPEKQDGTEVFAMQPGLPTQKSTLQPSMFTESKKNNGHAMNGKFSIGSEIGCEDILVDIAHLEQGDAISAILMALRAKMEEYGLSSVDFWGHTISRIT